MSTLEEGREMERVGDQLVAAARALREQLIAEQAETEERATYSEEIHEALLEAGFYRMYVPRRYGGLEVDVPTFMRVGVELARGRHGRGVGRVPVGQPRAPGRLVVSRADPGRGVRRR